MQNIVKLVVDSLEHLGFVQIEVSARHVHLCQRDVEILFGTGYMLTPKKELSQPDQFVCNERVTIIGSKGQKENVAVLGPARNKTQAELSVSDCIAYGVDVHLRQSGDVEGTAKLTIRGTLGEVTIDSGCIVALSHIHITPEYANMLNLVDGEKVNVKAFTDRPIIYQDVIVRVSDKFSYKMHVDFDEANAAHINGFTLGKIIKV